MPTNIGIGSKSDPLHDLYFPLYSQQRQNRSDNLSERDFLVTIGSVETTDLRVRSVILPHIKSLVLRDTELLRSPRIFRRIEDRHKNPKNIDLTTCFRRRSIMYIMRTDAIL